jgi:hypothetical protein
MKKADELERGCIAKAADDEPVFVLRANDKLAPVVVRAWAAFAKVAGVGADKRLEAETLAMEMEVWQAQNGSKVPD